MVISHLMLSPISPTKKEACFQFIPLSLSLSLSLFSSCFSGRGDSETVHFAWGLVSRDPQVSQPTHLTPTCKIIYSDFGVRGVGWETFGSLETSKKGKGI